MRTKEEVLLSTLLTEYFSVYTSNTFIIGSCIIFLFFIRLKQEFHRKTYKMLVYSNLLICW